MYFLPLLLLTNAVRFAIFLVSQSWSSFTLFHRTLTVWIESPPGTCLSPEKEGQSRQPFPAKFPENPPSSVTPVHYNSEHEVHRSQTLEKETERKKSGMWTYSIVCKRRDLRLGPSKEGSGRFTSRRTFRVFVPCPPSAEGVACGCAADITRLASYGIGTV